VPFGVSLWETLPLWGPTGFTISPNSNSFIPIAFHGFEAPKEGHYHFRKQPGDQTHYGDGALVLLESLAREGKFDERALGRRFVEIFRPGTYSGYIDKATKGNRCRRTATQSGNPSQNTGGSGANSKRRYRDDFELRSGLPATKKLSIFDPRFA
jgi:hypothetical protein